MSRTPLFASLQDLGRREAALTGLTIPSRRTFMGAAVAGLLAAPRPVRATAAAPRIVIVGAGIAGLTAALTLTEAGHPCTVFEAKNQVGGRMASDAQTWRNGQVTEHCGELIDTGHVVIRKLAKRFGIPLDNLRAAEPRGATETYFFGDSYYPRAQATGDFAPVWAALQADLTAAGYPTTFHSHNSAGAALDAMSVHDWIDSRVPGGHASPLGQLLDVAYDIEYGAPSTVQSALNLVYLLGYQTDPAQFDVFGQSDERFHMRGGNDQLPRAIAQAVESAAPGTVQLNSELRAIARADDGTYHLRLTSGPGAVHVTADHVILALPFSVLRTLDIARAGFNPVKLQAIAELGYGSNAKLHLQFSSRYWNGSGPWGRSTGSSSARNFSAWLRTSWGEGSSLAMEAPAEPR